MDFRVLGPLEILVDGRRRPATAAGEAALELYEQEGNLPGAVRARRFLAAPAAV